MKALISGTICIFSISYTGLPGCHVVTPGIPSCITEVLLLPTLLPMSLEQLHRCLGQHFRVPCTNSSNLTPLGFCGFSKWEE
jgi:hypothetical protein